MKFTNFLSFSFLLAVIALFTLSVPAQTQLFRRCPGASPTPKQATVEVDAQGNVQINPCATKKVLFGGVELSTAPVSQAQRKFFASPSNATGVPAFRIISADDIPSLPASKINFGKFDVSVLGNGTATNTKFLRGDGDWSEITADKIVNGTFLPDRLGSGVYSISTFLRGNNTWTPLDASDIPALNTANITNGTFNTARLGTGTASASTVLLGNGTWGAVPSTFTAATASTVPLTVKLASSPTANAFEVRDSTNALLSAWRVNGSFNTSLFFGSNGGINSAGWSNVGLGNAAGQNLTSGGYNTLIGFGTGNALSSGSSNVLIGTQAGYFATGSNNVFLGYSAGQNNTGSTNTYLGHNAGVNSGSGSNNVFLGANAGTSITGSNKLCIENTSSATCLVAGDFSTDALTFNGSVSITGNLSVSKTITAAGTTGNQTINSLSGTVNIAAGERQATITNLSATANSLVFVTARSEDPTCYAARGVPSAGAILIKMNDTCTGETSVAFILF